MWRNLLQSIDVYFERMNAYGWGTVAVELLIVGLVIYIILIFLQGTRGLRLFRGLVLILATVFLVLRVLAGRMSLDRINVLATPVLYGIFFGSLVVFQPELRLAMTRIGEARWLRRLISDSETTITAVTAAVKYLATYKIGALIAIERQVSLRTIIENGVRIDAAITPELLKTIFWPGSAMHDLGVTIQEGRVAAAGCQFPLTESGQFDPTLGSRHRAAVGLTEDSDAVVIVVSEETGIISVAVDGKILRGFTAETLEKELRRLLYTSTENGNGTG